MRKVVFGYLRGSNGSRLLSPVKFYDGFDKTAKNIVGPAGSPAPITLSDEDAVLSLEALAAKYSAPTLEDTDASAT